MKRGFSSFAGGSSASTFFLLAVIASLGLHAVLVQLLLELPKAEPPVEFSTRVQFVPQAPAPSTPSRKVSRKKSTPAKPKARPASSAPAAQPKSPQITPPDPVPRPNLSRPKVQPARPSSRPNLSNSTVSRALDFDQSNRQSAIVQTPSISGDDPRKDQVFDESPLQETSVAEAAALDDTSIPQQQAEWEAPENDDISGTDTSPALAGENSELSSAQTQYQSVVASAIRSHWELPPHLSTEAKEVFVELYIAPDGTLADYRILKHSSSQRLNRSILAAIEKSAPFPPHPKAFPPDLSYRLALKFVAD